MTARLATHNDLAGPPVDVVQPGDLDRAKPETSDQHQDCEVSLQPTAVLVAFGVAVGCQTVAARYEVFQLPDFG